MAVQTIYSNKDSRVYKSESLIVPPTLPTGEAPLELNQPNMILDAKYNLPADTTIGNRKNHQHFTADHQSKYRRIRHAVPTLRKQRGTSKN